MKKYKVTVCKLETVIELDETLTEEQMTQEVFDFIAEELSWGYKEIEEDEY